MHLIPHELRLGGVFFPPMLLNAALGLVAAAIFAGLGVLVFLFSFTKKQS